MAKSSPAVKKTPKGTSAKGTVGQAEVKKTGGGGARRPSSGPAKGTPQSVGGAAAKPTKPVALKPGATKPVPTKPVPAKPAPTKKPAAAGPAPKPLRLSLKELLGRLESAGTEAGRTQLSKQGVMGESFGAPRAEIDRLASAIGSDHDLAEGLWQTGNFDGMFLASRLVVASRLTRADLERWVRRVNSYPTAVLMAGIAARTRDALTCVRDWTESTREFVRACGYEALAGMLAAGAPVGDDELADFLTHIVNEIHASPNRAKHAMNGAVIAIGVHRGTLREAAIKTAGRIGTVKVDHGESGGATPDASEAIRAGV